MKCNRKRDSRSIRRRREWKKTVENKKHFFTWMMTNKYNTNDRHDASEDTPLRSIAFCCAPLYLFGRFIELNVYVSRQFWWRRQRIVSVIYLIIKAIFKNRLIQRQTTYCYVILLRILQKRGMKICVTMAFEQGMQHINRDIGTYCTKKTGSPQ